MIPTFAKVLDAILESDHSAWPTSGGDDGDDMRRRPSEAVRATYPTPSNQCWPDMVCPTFSGNMECRCCRSRIGSRSSICRIIPAGAPEPAAPGTLHPLIVWRLGRPLRRRHAGYRHRGSQNRPVLADMHGTPYSQSLHAVESYQLLDCEAAKGAIDRDAKINQRTRRASIRSTSIPIIAASTFSFRLLSKTSASSRRRGPDT